MDLFLANFTINIGNLMLVQQETQKWHACTLTTPHRGTGKEMVHVISRTYQIVELVACVIELNYTCCCVCYLIQ